MVFFRFFSQCFSLKKQCFQKLLRKICGIWCGAIFLPLQQSYTSTIMQQPKGTLQNLFGAVKQSVWEPCVCVCVLCWTGTSVLHGGMTSREWKTKPQRWFTTKTLHITESGFNAGEGFTLWTKTSPRPTDYVCMYINIYKYISQCRFF